MTSLTAQRQLDLSNYTLFWHDEFDYTGTQAQIHYQMFDAPNAKWYPTFSDNKPFFGNTANERRMLLRDNITVSGGTVKLISRYDDHIPDLEATWQGVDYTTPHSRSVMTAKYDQDYHCLTDWGKRQIGFNFGIFEIRAKLPRRVADQSAFWLWATTKQCGNDSEPHTCPPSTSSYTGLELDIFESKQLSTDYIYWSSQLANYQSDPNCTACKTYYDWNNSDNSETFHTYTFAWTPTQMTWFIDGHEIRTQTHGVPQLKMELILSCLNWSTGLSEDYEIDYIRIYRPQGINYTPVPSYYNGRYVGDNIWDGWGDSNRQLYKNAYQNNSYFLNETHKVYQGPDVTGIPVATAIKNVGTNHDHIYYNKGNDKIYQVNSFGNYSFTNPTTIVSSDVHNNSNIAVHPTNGNLYWKSNSGRLKIIYQSGGSYYIAHLDKYWQYPSNVQSNILVSPANTEHGTRVYYINTSNRLCYYEYCSGWYRHETPITGVAEFTISSNPQGKIFYKGLDNHVYTAWKFWDNNTPCNSSSPVSNWYYGSLDSLYSSDYADCAGDLAVSPDGTKVFIEQQVTI